jgi:hypothetical protein
MANKDTQNRIDALVTEEKLQNNIADVLTSKLNLRTKEGKIAKELAADLKSQTGVENKLEKILEKKQELLEGGLKLSKNKAQLLLKELETAEELLKIEKKRADKTAEIKELLDGTKDSLLESLGLSKEMFKNGVMFGLGMLAAKKGAEMLTAAFDSTVGQAKEMYKTFGASVKESARIGMEVGKASFSMTGLIYGGEAVAQSASDIANYFNSTATISSDTLKNVTELSALMGDGAGAVRMNTILKSVDDKAIDITDNIKDIATKSGVTAASVFKEMDKQAGKLLGKSEKEIEIIAKQTAAMVKLGVTKENLATVSESVLDIENSIAAQNKARLFGVEMNSQAIRDAAVAYQYGGGSAEDFAKAIAEQVGSAEEFGKMAPGIQKIYANQIGMTTDEITDMLLKQEELTKNTEKYGKDGAKTVAKIKEGFGGAKSAILASLPALAQSTTFLKNMGMDTSKLGGLFSKLNPGNLFKGMPTPDFNFKGKSGAAPPTPTPTPSGDGPTKAMGGINATSLLKGAAAMLVMAAALYVLGKAIQLFTGDDILGGLVNAVIALTVFTAAMFGLGALIAGPGAAIFGAGVAGFLMLGAALIVLGAGLESIAQSLQIFSQLPATFAFVEGLSTLTAKLAEFAIVGLLAAPAMLLVSKFGADITGGSSETTTSNTKQSDPLLEEIRGLRADIKSQPINVVLNGKIVGEINKGSRAINSYVNK